MDKLRAIVYLDGFNLYYGAIRGGPYKWLDLGKYFRLLRPHDDIEQIHYFTARVDGPTLPNQLTYLRALETVPLVNVVMGKFKAKRVRCLVKACTFTGPRFFQTLEEKRTDVNIALQMLEDAYEDRCDLFILVSGDSDLVPGVARVKHLFPHKKVIVYVPARNAVRGAAVELRGAADKHRNLPLNLLKYAQFPPRIPDGAGGFISKPPSW